MLLGVDIADVEADLGVELLELVPEVESGGRDRPDTAPGPVSGLEDSSHGLLGLAVAFALDRPGVLVLDDRPTVLQLADRHQDSLE